MTDRAAAGHNSDVVLAMDSSEVSSESSKALGEPAAIPFVVPQFREIYDQYFELPRSPAPWCALALTR